MSDNSSKQTYKTTNERFGMPAAMPAAVSEATQDKEEKVMSFNNGGVYLGMKLVHYYDPETGKFKDPVPRVTYIVNGKFNNVPLNGKWWKAYAAFVNKFAEVIGDHDLERATIIDDVDRAKQLMAQFKE